VAVKKTEQLAIDYTARDFSSIRNEITTFVKRYYPNSFKDFNEASFGSLMIDMVAYVGDMLSFYLDYQANESFLQTALEFDNVTKIAKQMGYNYNGVPTSHGDVSFFALVPAQGTANGPDTRYLPLVKRGTLVGTPGGSIFTLAEDINFQNSDEIVVATVDNTTGLPLTYAVKQSGKVISGKLNIQEIEIGQFQKFLKVEVPGGRSIAEIVSVYDSNGNQYFEVDYLSQDVVYKEIKNPDITSSGLAPQIIKPISVPRRFVVERDANSVYLQFGHGSEAEIKTDPIAEPNKTVLNLHGRDFISEQTFDPSNLISSDKLGVAPSNTTLTIIYRQITGDLLNAPVGTISEIVNAKVVFTDRHNLDDTLLTAVNTSLECVNEEPIVGDNLDVTVEEVKQRAYGSFYSQNRAVTAQDYKTMVYSMPEQFGSISRCAVVRDNNSFTRNLNLYVLAKDRNGKLTQANETLKQNLKFWINRHRMINDSVDILDARIVNLGIIFEVLGENTVTKSVVLQRCQNALADLFEMKPDIGEPLSVTRITKVLNSVVGVADTLSVQIIQKVGANYSDASYDIEQNYSADRRYLLMPFDASYEFKYKNSDFEGTVK
jgi:hypothetical protein